MEFKQSILYLIIFHCWICNAFGHLQEYCAGEIFNAKCSPGEVIPIQNAIYGRIRIGRCIDRMVDMEGYLGCSVNALHYFDNMCSNREHCRVEISATGVPLSTGCWQELKNNLEAQYSCKKVMQFNCEIQEIIVNSNSTISSQSLSKCNKKRHIISAQPGQQLNVSLIDFNWDDGSLGACRQKYGTVRDVLTSNMKDLCSGNVRQHPLMLSNGNAIELTMNNIESKHFLINIEVLGCGDVNAREDTWVRREGEELRMGCHHGKHTWSLRCVANQWIGATGQCGTRMLSSVAETETNEQFWGLSPWIIAFAVCCCLMFFSSVIFLLAVCVHTRNHL